MPFPRQLTLLLSLFALVLALVLGLDLAPGWGQFPVVSPAIERTTLTLEQFRPQPGFNFPVSSQLAIAAATCTPTPERNPSEKASTAAWFQPHETIAPANSTNYGERFRLDFYSNPANHAPIVVLHETVGSGSATIRSFQTPHQRESDQASYHALIQRSGEIVYLVLPDKRAFGAGNSVFVGPQGPEAVKTHPLFPPSVNNFAYHISLVTPADGRHNGRSHSGYTRAQYQSLAWLVAQTGVEEARITTHKAVDRSGERIDPRSFNMNFFWTLFRSYRGVSSGSALCVPST